MLCAAARQNVCPVESNNTMSFEVTCRLDVTALLTML